MSLDLEDLHVGDGFYDAMGYLIPWLSGHFIALLFIECSQMLEVCLRSYCYRSVFNICMVHLLSSWCVKMVGS